MSSPMSDLSDASPPPQPSRRRQPQSDDESDASDARPSAPAAKSAPPDIFTDDEDEEVAPKSRPGRRQATPGSDDDILKDDGDGDSDMGDDLFGDGSDQDMGDAEPSAKKKKTLDDIDIDSDDSLGADSSRRRTARDPLDDLPSEEERDETSYEVDVALHPLPYPSTSTTTKAAHETYLLKLPPTIATISERQFKPETFRLPDLPAGVGQSAYTYSTSAVRWRRDPSNPHKLQSNSRIIEWSDGTFSLQVGSAKELFDLPTNPLCPTPNEKYKVEQDSFTFLAEPLANSSLVRFFSHVSKEMSATSARKEDITDDTKQMIAARYAASQKRGVGEGERGKVELAYRIEDPEKARREAEALEKEAERYRKKVEAQRMRDADLGAGVGGGYKKRSGGGGGYKRDTMGLTADDLEEERYDQQRSGGAKKGGKKGYQRYNEEDYEEDDFVEADPDTDEEPEIIDDDSEEEEEYVSSRKKDKKSSKDKKKKSKRREEEEDDEDDEPEAEFTDDEDRAPAPVDKSPSKPKARTASADDDEDDDEPSKASDRKRRRLVMDDSDEE